MDVGVMAAWCEAYTNALNALCEQNVTAGWTVGAVVVFIKNLLFSL